MNHAIKSKTIALLIKSLILALLLAVITFFLGMVYTRNIVILGAIIVSFLQVRRYRHSKSHEYDDVGYWSGIGHFDIGFDRNFFDADFGEDFDFGFNIDDDGFDWNNIDHKARL